MAMIYQAIQFARDAEMRAVSVKSATDNLPTKRDCSRNAASKSPVLIYNI